MSAVPPPPGSGPPVGSNLADKPVDSGGKPATSPSFSGNGTIGRLITAGVLSPPKSDQERLEVLQKQYAAHVTGSAALQPRDSLAMRSEIDRLSSIVHPGQQSLWSDYSPAEKNYLAQQAAEKRRQANNIGMWFGGPVFAGLPAAARLLNAPEAVVENLAGINANLAGVLPFGARPIGGRPAPRNLQVQQKQVPPPAPPALPGNGTVVNQKASVGKTVSQKQNRHIEGRKEYRGGGYLKSQQDAQSVLDAYHSGSATVLGTNKQGFPVVRVDAITAVNVNQGAGISGQATNVFMIKGTASPSVVPMNPNWKP